MVTGCSAVDDMNQLNIQGNVVPMQWYKNITFKNNKPNFVAITLLSDIVYWYRPTVVRDELTGQIVETKKKFKADMLQRNYQAFSDQFGFTKRQVKEAMDFLVEHNLVVRQFRDIKAASGISVNNVMYLEPVVENIKKITYEEIDITLLRSNVPPHTINGDDLPHSVVSPSYVGTEDPPTPERRTNTEITTEITTDKKEEEEGPAPAHENPFRFFEQNGFGTIGGYIQEKISSWCNDLNDELIVKAMKIAVERGAKSWSYVEKILINWAEKKITSVKEADALIMAHQEQSSKRRTGVRKPFAPVRQEQLPDWFDEPKFPPPVAAPAAVDDKATAEKRKALEERMKKYRTQEE
ncbi:DnaD domain-containing protein [Bacillus infantis]|uniref:DnaD domain-containing protein n=1 Tax=Bacillus infantis TaxID=324767 RepID=UPI003CFA0919